MSVLFKSKLVVLEILDALYYVLTLLKILFKNRFEAKCQRLVRTESVRGKSNGRAYFPLRFQNASLSICFSRERFQSGPN